uniref:Uncharacterized protein n=1 Tax=Panagrellus redivivus TaxID=6233 RepID=A0A7E4W5L3_PANRE
MKLFATVCIFITILEPGGTVKCYGDPDSNGGLFFKAPDLKTLKGMKRNGTYSLKIHEGCDGCSYEFVRLRYPPDYAIEEHFDCLEKGILFARTHRCKKPEIYSKLNATVWLDEDTLYKDEKFCDTDLCNTPCYPDDLPEHSPSASNSNGSDPSPNANPKDTTTSGGIGLYNFSVVLQLGYTTTITAFFKWQM